MKRIVLYRFGSRYAQQEVFRLPEDTRLRRRYLDAREQSYSVQDDDLVESLLFDLTAAEDLLITLFREMEESHDGAPFCISCGLSTEDEPHDPDCPVGHVKDWMARKAAL